MRVQQVQLAAVATSAAVVLDREANPFALGLQLVFTGTATAQVEGTLDNVLDSTITPVWTILAAPFNSGSTSVIGGVTSPFVAVRLNVTAFTNGTVTLKVLQGKQG